MKFETTGIPASVVEVLTEFPMYDLMDDRRKYTFNDLQEAYPNMSWEEVAFLYVGLHSEVSEEQVELPEGVTSLKVRTGLEGPTSDPYGYVEVEVTCGGHIYEVHQGLSQWLKVDGAGVCSSIPYHQWFEDKTGKSPGEWEDLHQRIHENDPADPMGSLCDYE